MEESISCIGYGLGDRGTGCRWRRRSTRRSSLRAVLRRRTRFREQQSNDEASGDSIERRRAEFRRVLVPAFASALNFRDAAGGRLLVGDYFAEIGDVFFD